MTKKRFFPTLALALLAAAPQAVIAADVDPFTRCVDILDDAERLRCYDAAAAPAAAPAAAGDDPGLSVFARRWAADAAQAPFLLTAWRENYVLPIAYATRPNTEPFRATDPDLNLDHNEVKFQVSLHLKLLENVFTGNGDLWFGYTQRSFWQLYNRSESSPFRGTDYEPEFRFSFKTNYRFLGLTGRMIELGYLHASNGQSRPLSRSWDRLYARFGFDRGNFALVVMPWTRLPEDRADDDNRDITDFMGHGEINAYYHWRRHIFGLMLRNVIDDDRRYASELNWSFPLADKHLRGMVQWFNGYGESLIDYDHKNHRLSIGVVFTDWL